MKTTATNAEDGTKFIRASKTIRVNDKVCYTNLKPGKEYELFGKLMNKATSPIRGWRATSARSS